MVKWRARLRGDSVHGLRSEGRVEMAMGTRDPIPDGYLLH
jgi:hypothetical protein